ncbi:hypothetical protein T552_01303 [Pneumocystis carinii B80]|uniref:Large ribosomal subunit protein bL21m n=1 Tax=Pneumocystis carinii (strain B80) TaxID=1408658 RepID=A0A0W4ZLX4_PNEC8|nr:hypothetical protein T552_01303 [Pneumocystis carinii B80]KTW29348.1 hypothetical protein T552_01303 [Pneumocystis carinii B80]
MNNKLIPLLMSRYICFQRDIKGPVGSIKSNVRAIEKFMFERLFYAVIHIYNQSFIVTEGDLIRIPQKLRDVNVGDIIRLNCVSKLGSRNYTLKGEPYIDEKRYTCRARVLEKTKAPMSYFIKKKRRQRRIKVVKSKQDYTILREINNEKKKDKN